MAEPLAAIVRLEESAGEELARLQRELDGLDDSHRAALEQLYKRRQELVSGKAAPSAEELAGWGGPSSPSGSAHGGGSKGVPLFWLAALSNQDAIAEELSSRDRQALAHCTSLRAVYPGGGAAPTLEASFSANPFFTNATLRRCLGGGGAREVTTAIQWKDTAHNLTVKEVVKKGGGGGGKKKGKGGKGGPKQQEPAEGGDGARAVKLKPCPSFFSLFLPEGAAGGKGGKQQQQRGGGEGSDEDEEDGAPAASAKAQRDEAVMSVLLEQVLPAAARLYTSAPLQPASDDDDEDEGGVLVHGTAGGDPSDHPVHVQPLLAALQHNQDRLDAAAAAWQAQRSKVKVQRAKVLRQLADERRALLLPKAGAGAAAGSTSVPRFWLRVLRSIDAAALAISPRDAAVLASLLDVRFSLGTAAEQAAAAGSATASAAASSGDGELRGRLTLEFLPNEHLLASASSSSSASASSSAAGEPATVTLSKDYTFLAGGREPRLLSSHVAAAPRWASPARDPTHRLAGKALRPASSVFQLLRPGGGGGKLAFNLIGTDKEVQAEANELEVELCLRLADTLLPGAGQAFARLQAARAWPAGDDAAGDAAAWSAPAGSDTEAEAADDGEDEGAAAHRAAQRRSRAQQRARWWPTGRGAWLLALVGMLVLAEVLVRMLVS